MFVIKTAVELFRINPSRERIPFLDETRRGDGEFPGGGGFPLMLYDGGDG